MTCVDHSPQNKIALNGLAYGQSYNNKGLLSSILDFLWDEGRCMFQQVRVN